LVEGVTLIEPPQQSILEVNPPWSCGCGWQCKQPEQTIITNVKLLGWNFADGIHAGSQAHVSHSFIRVNDDGVKPFLSDALFENLVIWQQQNGWALMLSWLTVGVQRNITVRNVSILHDGHDHDYPVSGCDPCIPNQATIGAVHGGSGTVTDVIVENVDAETSVWRPIWIGIDKSTWASQGGGHLQNWTLRNVRFAGGSQRSTLMGSTSSNCSLNGIHVHQYELSGKVAQSAAAAHMDVLDACSVDFHDNGLS